MDDSVQVHCTRCKSVFRERAARLRGGYSRQCPTCEVILFFEDYSPDTNIKRAMTTARRIRKELRELEVASLAGTGSAGTSRSFAGRRQSAGREEGEDED
ncbi:hypothetical protein JQ604_28265 [Bradyrhizobium jicamae]|uniref:hypothetical protein n=1 Tax=Bradyrhizobium jicamae TaxID=280332 RepID=UPI001BADDFB2|nr:hypothetical protein [Bradyrhizobium jicamae]MBR0756087.1 hypothetical protein [Bradyrhizobium jicamae]